MIVGVDIGTQSLKAVVCDDDFAVRGEGSAAYAPAYPQPGWAEQDPALWLDALAPAIGAALAAAGARAADVRGIAVAGQLDGCVPTDADGRALGRCLIWSDRRAADHVASVDAAALRARTGVTADASHLAAKIAWLGPDTAARFHQPVSFVTAALCGEHVVDHALASTSMVYDLAAADYADDLLAQFGIDRARLPRIARAVDRAGSLSTEGARLTGLPARIAVGVGTGDDFSTPLGAGIVAPGTVACVLGTAEVVGALAADAVIDDRGLVETHPYPSGCAFVENPGWLSGGAIEWWCAVTGLADAAALDTRASAAPPGAGGVAFLPALSGAMAPEWNAGARAALYGMTAAHDAGHLARAVLEGCAFAMRDVVDRLVELGVTTDDIELLGGGARSGLWGQIRADATGLAVRVPAVVDTSPIGAAMCAAVACGAAADLVDCAERVRAAPASITEPDLSARAAYDDAYARYRALFDSLRPLY